MSWVQNNETRAKNVCQSQGEGKKGNSRERGKNKKESKNNKRDIP